MTPLTKRQRELLDYLGQFIHAHGYAPSLEEICRAFHLSALSTVHKHLEHLREKGWIRRKYNHSRALELVTDGFEACPTCGAKIVTKGVENASETQ